MNEGPDHSVWESFFSLTSRRELLSFADALSSDSSQQKALKHYIESWNDLHGAADADYVEFEPAAYVARDLSAIKYGDFPVIFAGSNGWSSKPYLATQEIRGKLDTLKCHILRIRKIAGNARICIILVMEKDHLIDFELFKSKRFSDLEGEVDLFCSNLQREGVQVLFSEPLRGISAFMDVREFMQRDSHLPGRIYVNYLSRALPALGVEWNVAERHVSLVGRDVYGDLNEKYEDGVRGPQRAWLPYCNNSERVVTEGSPTFCNPLGDTHQSFTNPDGLVDRRVGIFGDSHSSIFYQQRLTYLFACVYKKAEFFWNPLAIREMPSAFDYDDIVFEVSCRFVL